MSDNDVRASLGVFIRWVLRDLTYRTVYAATVELDNGDGTVDVRGTDGALKGRPFRHVPLRTGTAGCSARLAPGARCLLGFYDATPRKPYVAGWLFDKGSGTVLLDRGKASLARKGDSVKVLIGSPVLVSGVMQGTAKVPNPSPPPPTFDVPIPPGSLFTGAVIFVPPIDPVRGTIIGGARRVKA